MENNSVDSRTFSYLNEKVEALREEMDRDQSCVERTVKFLSDIAIILFAGIHANLEDSRYSEDKLVPIYILRGGLIMRESYERVFSHSPSGLIAPYRASYDHATKPVAGYGNFPVLVHGGIYIILDLVINSGNTIIEVLRSMNKVIPNLFSENTRVFVVAVYATKSGIRKIFNEFPEVELHVLWGEMEIGSDKRLVGVNFDAGDYAFGGAVDNRIHWGG